MGRRKIYPGRWPAVLLILIAFPATVRAHTQVEGLGDVLNGILHPLTTPPHLLILLGLGLLVGQQPPPNLKTPMVIFLPIAGISLLVTLTGVIANIYPPILVALALVTGALVAMEVQPPRFAYVALLAAAAVTIGLDSGVESGSGFSVLKRLFGTWVSLGLTVFNLAYYETLWAKQKWQKVGIRVLGSWLIAISFLVLAFSLKR